MPLAAQKAPGDIGVRLEHSGANEPLLYLNQPAYVALFELVPGRGIVQLYPLTKYEAAYLVEPGYRQIVPARADMARRVSWQAATTIRDFTPGFHAGIPGPVTQWASAPQGFLPYRHVVAIASSKPLKVGTPNQTMSYLHLAMPTLWSPASFTASPTDLEALIDAVVPPGAATGVSAIELSSPIYTMVTYSPRAWATYSGSDGSNGDEIWADCLGMRIRVPDWYLREGLCTDQTHKNPAVAVTTTGPIGLVTAPAPSGVLQVSDRTIIHEVPMLTPVSPAAPGESARGTLASDRGTTAGRDIGTGGSAGRGSPVESRAGAPGTVGSPAPGAATPRRDDGAGSGIPRAPSPSAAPARPAGSGSRERPVP
jgi:hypothetical protein